MISYEAYKVLHLVAVLALFGALGGVAVHAANGGTRETNAVRRAVAGIHGIALLLILIAGFGLMARLGLVAGGWPLWIYGKLGLWLVALILLALPYRRPALARPVLVMGLPLLGLLAAWLAVFKPA